MTKSKNAITNPRELLDREFPVLDKGFVRLVDYMGSDDSIVQAARVSYGAGTKKVSEDRGLIRYLMRHSHTTPFEMVEFKFHVKLPIFIARQWIRHRTASVNEYSGRYSVMEDEFYVPSPDTIKYKSKSNKQGRGDDDVPIDLQKRVIEILSKGQRESYEIYETLLEEDIARELSRINLPLSLYTQWYWKIDLHNLFHFLKLRMDEHAQREIREYAFVIADIVKAVVPASWEAFEDYSLEAIHLFRKELLVIRELTGGLDEGKIEEHSGKFDLKGRELDEFLLKVRKINSICNSDKK
jgi:thymidylate synthase (FAD)